LKRSLVVFIIIASLVMTYLFYMFTRTSYNLIGYSYKVGQIADRDIIAPFTFSVNKTEEAIEKEKESIMGEIDPIYFISDNIKFDIIQKLDSIMDSFIQYKDGEEEQLQQHILSKFGIDLDLDVIKQFRANNVRLDVYSHLMNNISNNYTKGVYAFDINRDTIQLAVGNEIKNTKVNTLTSLGEFKTKIVEDYSKSRGAESVKQIADYLFAPNVLLDQERTNQAIQDAFRQINPVLTEVLENEEIIRKNRRVTELDLRKLEALSLSYKGQVGRNEFSGLMLSVISYLIYALILVFTLYLFFCIQISEQIKDFKHQMTFILLLLLNVLFVFVIRLFPSSNILILPFSFSVVTFALVFSPVGGFMFSVVSYFLILPFFNWNVLDSSILFLTSFVVLVIMTRMKDMNDLVPLSIYLLITFLVVVTIVSLLSHISLEDYGKNLMNGAISTFISITGIILLSPIIQKKLDHATKMILLELLDTNNPLLKRLAVETPGTFHHSITVGILAENAAEAIGANPQLARVGSYYHDIGKLENPQIFVENNSKSDEIHNKMAPYESASNIKNHVAEGIALAKKHNLPQQVIDIISQHHGDSRVAYFYNKAKEQNIPIEDENHYRYYGPKPRTKEAALVMIADIVESTAKVQMHQHTEESLKKIINDTVQRLILENQLSEAPITLKELETVKSYMLPIILGIYRKRIEYPKDIDQE